MTGSSIVANGRPISCRVMPGISVRPSFAFNADISFQAVSSLSPRKIAFKYGSSSRISRQYLGRVDSTLDDGHVRMVTGNGGDVFDYGVA